MFLGLDGIKEIFMGGGAGSGKSIGLLTAGLQYIDVPGYRGIIFRRTRPRLTAADSIVDLSKSWLTSLWGSRAFNETRLRWTNPETKATLDFGHIERVTDWPNWGSTRYDFIGWDELPEFAEVQFLGVSYSRQRRSAKSKMPLRIRSSGTPVGEGVEWVYDRYFTQTDPDRLCIPATMDDNVFLDREDYLKSLMKLDLATRERLLRGDWLMSEKTDYFDVDQLVELISPPELRYIKRSVRTWDIAATEQIGSKQPDWSVGLKMDSIAANSGLDYSFLVSDIQRGRWGPAELERNIRATARMDGRKVSIYLPTEPGAAGKIVEMHWRRMLAGYHVEFHRETGSKTDRALPLTSQVNGKQVAVLKLASWLREFKQELSIFSETCPFDDQVDACAHALDYLASTGARVSIGVAGR